MPNTTIAPAPFRFAALFAVLALNLGFAAGWYARKAGEPIHALPRPTPARAAIAVAAPPPAPVPPPPAFTGCSLPPAPEVACDEDGAIVRENAYQFRVRRSYIDCVLSHPVALARAARFIPTLRDGSPNGIRLYAIRPSSLLARLGLQNGDVLLTVNGMPLTTPEHCLAAYSRVRPATQIVLRVERKSRAGATASFPLRYRIIDGE